MSGSIHTFYSYKGGVGRTLCLANVAILLARWGWKVLCVDMDLEAPGLAKYFAPLPGGKEIKGGVVDWLTDVWEGRSIDTWTDRIVTIKDESLTGGLSLLPAGNAVDHGYLSKVQGLDWTDLYRERNMGEVLEAFKASVRSEYDMVLIDSRTGVSDSGGICTIQLPDAITFFFIPNEQSLYGASNTMRHVQTARLKSVTEPGPALMLPVLTRFEHEKEYRKAREWKERILDEVADFYLSWIPSPRYLEKPNQSGEGSGISPALREEIGLYLDQAIVPQVAYWSFGEPLPVLEETNPSKDMISFVYENIAALIANHFTVADELLKERRSYLARARKRESSERFDVFLSYAKEDGELAQSLETALARRGVRVWRDTVQLQRGSEWVAGIEALRQSDSLVVIDSGKRSRWIDDEVTTFIHTREEESEDLKIIPVTIGKETSSPLLKRFNGLDGRSALSDPNTMEHLADRIESAVRSSQPMSRTGRIDEKPG